MGHLISLLIWVFGYFIGGETQAPDNRLSMLNCRFCVFIQPRIFLPQNAGKTRDKLPYRELSCLKWPLNFCGLVDGLLLCLSGTTIIRGSKFWLFMGHEFSLFFWVFEVFHRWGPGPLYKRSSRLKSCVVVFFSPELSCFKMFCSFVKVDEILASSRETFACFMSQDSHTG